MTLLPLCVSLCIPLVRASLASFNGTTIPMLDISDSSSSSNTRTLWTIMWSCSATLFACTWTAIHPNIPGMNEGKVAISWRRLLLMIMALFAPELMITWAARQFFSARKAAKKFNDTFGAQVAQAHGDDLNIGLEEGTATLLPEISQSHETNNPTPSASKATVSKYTGWTTTHGFFAWMGGFMLYVNDEPQATLTPDELLRFVIEGSVDMPVITEADIEDRSKGDALAKGIVILQLVWFMLQLVARYVQKLPVTMLEIDTLAVASLTCITYGLWWKKPKDVGRPYPAHWKATASQPTYDKAEVGFTADNLYIDYLIYPLSVLIGLPSLISRGAVQSRRVSSLGGYAETHDITVFLIGCVSGMVFGGAHCAGWNVLSIGQIEWRVASLAILCTPVYVFLCFCYMGFSSESKYSDVMNVFLVTTIMISFAMYIVARAGLIVLMLWSLRSLPPGVYDTVAWTKLIPHY